MSNPVRREAPLEGLRVLDIGDYLAGPLASLLLADQGADVLHIDSPHHRNSPCVALDSYLQRNKRRATIDLSTQQGRDWLLDLVRGADVLIENHAPGMMQRLGLGYEECRKANSKLIYLSLPGFASTDQNLAQTEGWEPLIGALTGLFTNISFTRDFLGLPPVYTALKLPSVYAAVHGATAVMMSLVQPSPEGEHIEVPLASAMMSAMGAIALQYSEQPERYDLPPVSRAFKTTQLPVLKEKFASLGTAGIGQALSMAAALTPPMMSNYECADGRMVYVFAMDHVRMSKALLRELGLIDQFSDRLIERDPYEATSVDNNLSDVGTMSKALKDEIKLAMTAAFRTQPASYWEQRLSAVGVPCALVRTTSEWLKETHVRKSLIAVEVQDITEGPVVQPGPSVWISDSPVTLQQPRSRIPASTAEPADWLPRASTWSATPGAEITPTCLKGLRVLDLSTMIAGPACARTLAEYGAEVIKVDSVSPYLGPRMSIWYSPELNQGKKSILLDLKTPDGRNALLKLVESADVLVHNMRPGVLEQLDLGKETLLARQPSLVVTNISAYAGPEDGPWRHWPGYDPVVQAASGVSARYGSPASPEVHAVASTIDYLTGYLAAFGTAIALTKRGEFRAVDVSLAQATMIAQLPYTVSKAGHLWPEPSGQVAMGEGPASRLYQALDGWVFLHAEGEDAWSRLTAVARKETDPQQEREDQDYVSAWIGQRHAAQVISIAAEMAVTVVRVETLDALLSSRSFSRDHNGFVEASKHSFAALIDSNHPSGRKIRTIAPLYARLRSRPVQLGASSVRHGANTREILEASGTGDADRMFRYGTATENLSEVFLPG